MPTMRQNELDALPDVRHPQRGRPGSAAVRETFVPPLLTPALRFAIGFVSIVAGLSAAVLVDGVVFGGAAAWMLSSKTAAVATAILQFFGANAVVYGNQIHYRTFICRVIPECTGIDMIGLFVAAVSAFPSGWRHKFLGLAVGVPILIALNLVRIVVLVHTGDHWPGAVEPGHAYVAPLVILSTTLGLWWLWTDRVTDDASY